MQKAAAKNILSDKTLLILSITVFTYLVFIVTSYRLKFDSITLVGVVREALDIPAFLCLAFLFVVAVIAFVKNKYKLSSYPFYSLLILSAGVTVMSIFL